ncbi:glycosyltransferase family 2 protein [Alienimonas californiensis]|uniref:Undecaprenyl-phosphate mannosyltransferase n=1 Tax=Alienimonas californiensis TaxID=2527989 RepID=A0A517PCV1_9PLAN|nr:glycosyltransferase family 2 protein [Alienimonas californiensis]QDT17200.1 Undecaprenyl-phosphate mannosyltransferase [Alienimonas californiensis]
MLTAPTLTALMPAFNESPRIAASLDRLAAAPLDVEAVVVDDASTDGTSAAVREWAAAHPEFRLTLLRHPTNRGKGAAVRTALDAARGQFAVVQDADLEYDPADLPRVLEPLLAGEADVVYGSRRMGGNEFPHRWHARCVGLLNLLVRALFGLRITDEATCYKAFPTAVLRAMDLRCERFEFCPEVTAKSARAGLRVREVPVSYHARGTEEGKKIRFRDGLEAAWTLLAWRVRPFDGGATRAACGGEGVPRLGTRSPAARRALTGLSYIVSAGTLAALVWYVVRSDRTGELADVDPAWAAGAVAAATASFLVRAAFLWCVARAADRPVRPGLAVAVTGVGNLAAAFVPPLLAAAGRGAYLRAACGVPIAVFGGATLAFSVGFLVAALALALLAVAPLPAVAALAAAAGCGLAARRLILGRAWPYRRLAAEAALAASACAAVQTAGFFCALTACDAGGSWRRSLIAAAAHQAGGLAGVTPGGAGVQEAAGLSASAATGGSPGDLVLPLLLLRTAQIGVACAAGLPSVLFLRRRESRGE